ncbi:MAG: tetratricopeptide repeat protein [Bacteroidia bacterium]
MEQSQNNSKLEIMKTSLMAIGSIFIPLAIAYFGEVKAESELELRYIELAVGILNKEESGDNHNTKDWAIKIINKYSPDIKLDSATQKEILNNDRLTGTTISETNNQVILSEKRKYYESLILKYENDIQTNPDISRNHHLKGYALYALGEYDKAISSLNQSVYLDKSNPWPHYILSLVYWKLENKEKVIGEVNEFLKLAPSKKEYLINDREMDDIRKLPELQYHFP